MASVRVIVREGNVHHGHAHDHDEEEEDSVADQIRSILKNYGIETITIDIEVRKNQDHLDLPDTTSKD